MIVGLSFESVRAEPAKVLERGVMMTLAPKLLSGC